MVKFLIIRLSSIGDIVLTTPVVRCLKQQVEDAEIHYLTKKQNQGIIASNPYVSKVHVFEGDLDKTIAELKTEQFDYVIDLHNNLRSLIIKRKLKSLAFSFPKLNFKKWLLTAFKINRMPDVHIVDRYLQTVMPFDIKNDGLGLDFFIPDNDIFDFSGLPQPFQNGYVAFIIGGMHKTKQLSLEKIVYVLDSLKKPVLLLGGPDDQARGDEITKATSATVINMCGKYSLNRSASIVKQARVVITHDTGLMHVAAAFKKKIVSVWGNTVPEFGMYPYKADES